MGDTPAVDQLVEALNELREKADMSLGQIESWGKMQKPPVNLGKSKLSPWFQGKSVPDPGRPFDTLIRLLEDRALQKEGLPKRGVGRWQMMRNAAATERRFLPGLGNDGDSPKTSVVSGETSSPPIHVAADSVLSLALPSAADRSKAGRLLVLLPPDGQWQVWLRRAQTMFRVPLSVSHPVCDAYEALEDDPLDYVDPVLQGAHELLMDRLALFCDELNGMTDISDEGLQVLEMSHPGTAAERNDLNRQACQAREEFLRGYRDLINLLNARGLVPAGERDHLADVPPVKGAGDLDIGVDLLAGCTLSDGRIVQIPIIAAGEEGSQILSEPYYLVVTAANRSVQDVQIASMRIEMDYGAEHPMAYLVSPEGPGGKLQLPFQLSSHASHEALANAAELGHAFASVAQEHRVLPQRIRPIARTGSGIEFNGAWHRMDEIGPFLLKALRGSSGSAEKETTILRAEAEAKAAVIRAEGDAMAWRTRKEAYDALQGPGGDLHFDA
ncbi:hypothetical protein [Streptomyces sp. NPDC001930]|uniref:hypothetical protein n=1 Tax=Streptomyces sp. NPDC001930 TaxID=3364625 RepID=UPI0036B74908